MQQDNVIEVNQVCKKFKVYYDKGKQLKERVLFKSRNRYEEREVLKGISFSVKKGEAIGLIGNNGCGKSTTLKLLTKIMYPSSGTIEMAGRVSSLIELGAGFHPDMSGRENIYTNAAIFGLTRSEIDARLEDIISFSELGEYINVPVRTYSSGMYMRLAFSVAINVDADILLIDEILAVGDAAFQAKCFNRLREIKAEGTTIVIVSHSLSQVEQICDRAIWIREGLIAREGQPREVIQSYMGWIMNQGQESDSCNIPGEKPVEEKLEREALSTLESGEAPVSGQAVKESGEPTDPEENGDYQYTAEEIQELKSQGKRTEIGNRQLRITKLEVLDAESQAPKKRFAIGDSMLIRIHYSRINRALTESMCSFSVYRSDGLNCYSTNCFINTGKNVLLRDAGFVEILMRRQPFMQGEYKIDVSFNKDYGPTYHGILNAYTFEVYNTRTDYGVIRPDLDWHLNGGEADEE
ncbi:MAG: ABC transporter ATP-binding protein [Lachnospiraceae bacterium]|nr:ABC transporter ATP-binding protein [Lachnospiraceae bacterium]